VKPLWKTGKVIAVVVLLAAAGLAGGGWWLWQSGWADQAIAKARWSIIAATANLGFRVENVLVLGRQETPRDELLNAVHLARGAPILAFDPEAAKKRIEALPWVRAASVQRRLPDTIFLRVVERRPLAVWQDHGRFALIDYDGKVITDSGLERFAKLPLVVGDDAPVHAAQLLEMLWNQPELMARVKAAVRVGGRRWNVRLDNGIDVRLPEENAAAAWARLATYERTHHVLAKDVGVLDLRLPDRLIVQKARQSGTDGPGTET
jgi:cell division protein FtsQ